MAWIWHLSGCNHCRELGLRRVKRYRASKVRLRGIRCLDVPPLNLTSMPMSILTWQTGKSVWWLNHLLLNRSQMRTEKVLFAWGNCCWISSISRSYPSNGKVCEISNRSRNSRHGPGSKRWFHSSQNPCQGYHAFIWYKKWISHCQIAEYFHKNCCSVAANSLMNTSEQRTVNTCSSSECRCCFFNWNALLTSHYILVC